MKYEYTWRCDCSEEGTDPTFNAAKRYAKAHLDVCVPGARVFIDQYDLQAVELSGKYWIMELGKRIQTYA